MENNREICKNCSLYKRYMFDLKNENKEIPNDKKNEEILCNNFDPFREANFFLLGDNVLINHKFFNHLCLYDRETDRFVLESCKYYLHKLECCLKNRGSNDKSNIKEFANNIIKYLECYSDNCKYNKKYFIKRISELKNKHKELFLDDK